MSMVMQFYFLEKYGPRLTIDQIAEVMRIHPGTVHNRISAGTLGIRTYIDGGKRFADPADVAEYLEECRKQAA